MASAVAVRPATATARGLPRMASATGASTNVVVSSTSLPVARSATASRASSPSAAASPSRAGREPVTLFSSTSCAILALRRIAEEPLDQHRVLPLAVELPVAALDPHLGEARGAVQREACLVRGEDATGQLVVPGVFGGL